jgi:hypothetical protein
MCPTPSWVTTKVGLLVDMERRIEEEEALEARKREDKWTLLL